MTEQRQSLGKWGEEQAARFLRRSGMKIVARNLSTPVGEIDIIARKGKILIFAEVKTRRSSAYGAPQEAVGAAKQRQILRAASWYLNDQGWQDLQPRFDVLAVQVVDDQAQIEHITDAFGLSDW
ncbi:MAG: YraN family protein [Desulfuromonadales bacterium C00003094]|jgi:putative endonuclease|nr:MAG: YraN family protein [Desulfuromonadales bacterium C00003094]OEU74270.1 MAG: YraN family protein [Desulfuromonadales bacterium C00003107]